MGESKYKELILDAIDQLRKRKARPDLERICHMLERRHGLHFADVQAELQRLVDAEVVIKVDYKGNTSYRNAAKWVRTKSHFSGNIPNSVDVYSALSEAVWALTSLAGGAKNQTAKGVTAREIEKYLASRNVPVRLSKELLESALERETVAGNFTKLPSGTYIAKDTSFESVSTPPDNYAQDSATELKVPKSKPPSPTNVSPKHVPGKRGRPASRRKRFKKTHGPDFVEITSIPSSDIKHELRCDYCLLTAEANRKGEPEDLLVCKDCNAKAHPSCMDYSPELAARSRMSPWQCIDCKTCSICEDSGDGDSMLFCDSCDKGYHMSCHSPQVTKKPLGKWVCRQCTSDRSGSYDGHLSRSEDRLGGQRMAVDTATGLPTPCDSPLSEDTSRDCDGSTNVLFLFDRWIEKYPQIVPDAKNWTIDDVEKFFTSIGFPEQAPAFRDQEIDGKSLLLMKRSDVLTGLSIRLGPALKIYNHIKRLQARMADGHLL